MTALERARVTAENYFDEIRSTITIRQSFNDVVVSQARTLYSAFAHDALATKKLKDALLHKHTDTNSLYMALLIQANGVFEHYIRSFVAAVVEEKRVRVSRYSELGAGFRADYVTNSARVLSFIKRGDVNGQSYDFELLIDGLGGCFTDSTQFSLNAEVFTILMGNCTPERIEKLFSTLGLPEPFSPSVGENSLLKKRMNETRRVQTAKMAREELSHQIELRNRVAHGDLTPTITSSELVQAVEFFSALIDAFDSLATNS